MPELVKDVATYFGGTDYVNPDKFQEEVNADPTFAGYGNPITAIDVSDGSMTIRFASALDPAAEAIMNSYATQARLGCAKLLKSDAIDARTEELIVTSGFQHVAADPSQWFSTSLNAQSKWHAIMNLGQLGVLTYPVSISAKDESSYDIVDLNDLATMYGELVAAGKAHHDSGKALKDAVYAATTVAEVEAVQDNR